MDMRQLMYFVEVAQQQSFTKAAEKLNISQPALSKCIHNLEDELGTSLFVRKAGTITITDTGKIVLEKAKDLIVHFDYVQNTFRLINPQNKKNISIGCSPILSSVIDIDKLEAFLSDNNKIYMSYGGGTINQLVNMVFSMKIDMAICILYDREYKYLDKVNTEVIYEGKVIYASSGNIDESSKFVTSCDLSACFRSEDDPKVNHTTLYTDYANEIKRMVYYKGFTAIVPDIVLSYWDKDVNTASFVPSINYRIALITNKSMKCSKIIQQLKKHIKNNIDL
ncbi:LysR family transcriptional regulator [Frisingicoccus sp.]|uniref:LysR family transcriptional regulator n=1 Tax=Frisingicoccus sp. TaxID=1918627 RepID=UPI003AB76FC7